jgi:hypothetical protein
VGGAIEGIAMAKSKEGERKYIELLNERGQEDTGSTGKKRECRRGTHPPPL